MFGFETAKPLLTALALPPVPLIVLMLIGARLILPRRGLGFALVLLSAALLWLSACQGTGQWLQNTVLRPPAALQPDDLDRLRDQASAERKQQHPRTAIVVLGGGRVPRAAEYGMSDLSSASAERLRYAIWLARQTRLPIAFSGGVGWAQTDDAPSEAEIASRVAQQIYAHPIQWTETGSRDTQGNAALSLHLLKPLGITEIVLVTDAWHMRRALRAFETAAGPNIRITPAPMGKFTAKDRPALNWLPSTEGLGSVRLALREMLALGVGAY